MKDFAGRPRRCKETLSCNPNIDKGVVVEVLNEALDKSAKCGKNRKERERVAFQFLQGGRTQ